MNQNLRHEIKYRISYKDYLVYMSQLSKLLKKDAHGQEGSYTVSSLYFDDVFHTGYYEKIDGLKTRHKYRIRYYDDDLSKMKLERKSKYDQMTHKDGLWLKEGFKLEDINHMDSDEGWLKIFYAKYRDEILRPSSFVRYERVAFSHIIGNLRVTFDRHVRGISHHPSLIMSDQALVPLLEDDIVVMEIKFEGIFPEFLRSIFASHSTMAESTSKYVYSKVHYMC